MNVTEENACHLTLNGYDTEHVSGDASNEEALGKQRRVCSPGCQLRGLLGRKRENSARFQAVLHFAQVHLKGGE